MRGRPSFLRMNVALCGLLPLAAAGVACSSSQAPTTGSSVTLTPSIVGPEGLVANIAVFALQAYPASPDGGTPIGCSDAGTLTGGFATARGLVTKDGGPDESASGTSCGLGYERCFLNVTLPQSTPLVLSVTGYSSQTMATTLAVGCTTFSTTSATATADITLHPTEICGDGMLEPPETCDPGTGTDEECTKCQTNIDLLSSGTGAGGSNTVTGSPGDKRDPSFLWPSGGNFLAFFSDDSTNSAASEQISMRIRDSSFDPTAVIGAVAESNSIFLPNTPSGVFPPTAEMDGHQQPVAVQSGSDTYVVFAYETAANHAIVLRAMTTSTLDAVQTSPCTISDGTAGESGDLTEPSVAVTSINGSDVFYIAWQDDAGRVYGRTYTPTATGACSTTLGAQTLLSSGSSNSHVSVAGISGSWVVTWQSDANIVVRPIGSNGTPTSVAVPLSVVGVAPTIAAIPGTSNYAVAFSSAPPGSSATIFAQRFKMGSFPVDSSPFQVSQSSNGNGEVAPFIAAGSAAGGSYVVTWVDEGGAGQEVRARLLAGTTGSLASAAGTGYLQNAIDGTTGEFLVSDTAVRTRVSPTVVVGGANPGYMAFGWADNTSSGTFGILGRRFPVPSSQ